MNTLGEQKSALRDKIWIGMEKKGVARFPLPLKGRIPNFVGAEAAAKQLAKLPEWKAARVIVANPDAAQIPVRQAALESGKLLIMASPRLKAGYLRIKPNMVKGKERWAATIKGAFKFGEKISAEAMPKPDLIITGCVAVDRKGWRLGKGGGYGDREIRMFQQRFAKIPVATTVHELQIVSSVPHGEGDTRVDAIATPERVVRIRNLT